MIVLTVGWGDSWVVSETRSKQEVTMRTRRPRRSSTGRPFGSLQVQAIRAASSLSEELDDSWKEFFEDYRSAHSTARERQYLSRTLGVRWI